MNRRVVGRLDNRLLRAKRTLTASSGCKNRKRYQDVEEILAAGINAISTLNIQHLESINEFVEKATEVKVRETLPDRVVAKQSSSTWTCPWTLCVNGREAA